MLQKISTVRGGSAASRGRLGLLAAPRRDGRKAGTLGLWQHTETHTTTSIYDNVKETATNLMRQQASWQTALRVLEDRSSRSAQLNAKQQEVLQELRAERASLISQLDKQRAEYQRLKFDLVEVIAQCSTFKQSLLDIASEVTEGREDRDRLKSTLNSIDPRVQLLEERHAATLSERDALQAELQRLQEVCCRQEADMSAVQNRLDLSRQNEHSAAAQLLLLHDELDRVRTLLPACAAAFDQLQGRFRAELAALCRLAAANGQRAADLAQRLRAAAERQQRHELDVGELRAAAAAAAADHHHQQRALHGRVDELVEQCLAAECLAAEHAADRAQLAHRLELLAADAQAARADADRANAELAAQRRHVDDAADAHAADAAQLRHRLHSAERALAERDDELAALRRQHEHAVAAVRDQCAAEAQAARAQHEQEAAALRARADAEQKQAHSAAAAAQELRATVDRLRSAFQSEMAKANDDHQQQLAKLHDENTALRAAATAKEVVAVPPVSRAAALRTFRAKRTAPETPPPAEPTPSKAAALQSLFDSVASPVATPKKARSTASPSSPLTYKGAKKARARPSNKDPIRTRRLTGAKQDVFAFHLSTESDS